MKVYMDNAATTRVIEPVFQAMEPYFCGIYGNPSSVHQFGREAHKALDKARGQVASALGAKPEEIYFTGCGTEADNWRCAGRLTRAGTGATTSSPPRSSITRFCTPVSSWKKRAFR